MPLIDLNTRFFNHGFVQRQVAFDFIAKLRG
jgi:hypothetical protein